jgi:hypothetical protein
MTLKNYDEKLISVFRIQSFLTISTLFDIKRITFQNDDIDLLLEEALCLVKILFDKDDFLARISFWDKTEQEKYSSNCIFIEEYEDCFIGIFRFKFSDFNFKELLRRHLNYEKGLDPYLNITAYFFDLNYKTLLNIYDDRGADYLKK